MFNSFMPLISTLFDQQFSGPASQITGGFLLGVQDPLFHHGIPEQKPSAEPAAEKVTPSEKIHQKIRIWLRHLENDGLWENINHQENSWFFCTIKVQGAQRIRWSKLCSAKWGCSDPSLPVQPERPRNFGDIWKLVFNRWAENPTTIMEVSSS